MKDSKKVLAVFLAIIMMITFLPTETAEAATTKISKCKVSISKTSYNYTGSACKPKVVVKYKNKTLKNGKDYKVAYSNNVNPGTATVKITGKGKYSGTVKKIFKIKNTLSVTLSKKTYTYSGKANKPKLTVKSGKAKLASKYYSATYKNNVKAGTAQVIVKGKGKYKGKNALVTFKIAAKSLTKTTVSLSEESYNYSGNENKPTVTVKDGKKVLKRGTDYSVSYANNINVGTATVKVTGKGNYTGSVTKQFSIIAPEEPNNPDTPVNPENPVTPDTPAALTIQENSGILIMDQQHQITVLSHEGDVTYESSNANVARVDGSGMISTSGAGTADITVRDSHSSVSFTVKVVDFDFSQSGMELVPGETLQLRLIKGEGSCEYTWRSSDTEIVTVDQTGLITAVVGRGGTAQIRLEVDTLNGKAYSRGAEVKVVPIASIYNVEKTGSSYAAASGTAKAIANNMDFSLNLVEGGLDTAGENGNAFWHNTGLSTVYYGGYNYYFVSDTWNNRVLIYKVPETVTWGLDNHNVNQSQYLYCILGQTSINGSKAGYKLNELNWPNEAVAAVVGNQIKLFVTDTSNNRILVWDDLLSAIESKTAESGVHYAPSADYSIMEKCDVNKVNYNTMTDKKLVNVHESGIKWPWAVWTDGTRLMCTSTSDGYLLIWDTLPSKSDKYPDKVIYTGGTIRTIACKDNYVLLGDHNIQTADNRNVAGLKILDDYSIFNYTAINDNADSSKKLFDYAELSLKTSDVNANVYTYTESGGHQPSAAFLTRNLIIANGNTLNAGTLLLSHIGAIEVYKDGKIDGQNDKPDYYIGGGAVDDDRLYYFTSADYAPVIVDHNGNLYNSMGNRGIIAGYKAGTLPSEPANMSAEEVSQQNGDVFIYNGEYYFNNSAKGVLEKHCTAIPNVWIGSENVTDDAYKKTYRYQNCMVSSDGKHLVASSDCGTGSVLMLWKNIPDESEAKPDVVYEFTFRDTLNDTAIYNNGTTTMLITGGRDSIIIWNDINKVLDGGTPDIYYRGKVGSVSVREIQSFAYDGTYFYLSDQNGIYIFQGIPAANQQPVSTLNYGGNKIDVTTCDNGTTYLAIASEQPTIYTREEALKNGSKFVIKGAVREVVDGLVGNQKGGTRIYRKIDNCTFNGIGSVIVTKEGKVVVADTGFGRVLMWDSITEAVNEGNTNAKSATRIELGYGGNCYDIFHVLEADSSTDYHSMISDPIPNNSANTFFRPSSLAYDGTYLWVGDFKFSGGIKRIN